MDNDKSKKNKPLKLSSSGRLQIRKNLGPSGENKTTGNNKKTIQIVFRNKNNQQKSTSAAKSNFRGSSTFRTNTTVTPSFTPGYYNQGNGKDLGHAIEFKSEVQLSLDLPQNSEFGFSYNHLSNASLGTKNPGANSYMFNFLKKF